MKKLDASTYRTMPWKNGGGSTTEVLTVPPGATLETFEARVSMATVATSGPFSTFEGVDRTLVVTSGKGMHLETADGARTLLERTSRPFAFTGDDPCEATLVAGPITDLNVMTRRGSLRHRAVKVALDGEQSVTCEGALTLLAVLTGELVAEDPHGTVALAAGDFLVLSPGDPVALVRSSGQGAELLYVELTRGAGRASP